MRRHTTLAAVLAIALALSSCRNEENKPGGTSHGPKHQPMDCFCADTTMGKNLCWVIPHDIGGTLPGDYSGLDSAQQQLFDVFSWQSFVALNWPANPDGTPNTKDSIGDVTGPRVWDYYTDPIDLFGLPASQVPGHLQGFPPGTKILRMMAKNANIIDPISSFIQATGNPLIDRNLNFVLFEIRINPDETKYITSNNLQTAAGQVGKTIDFPSGQLNTDTVGAIEIKAAWRIMRPDLGDDTTRFFTRHATISIPPANTINNKPLLIDAQVGLVGIHILHKVTNGEGWVWSTFEHVDNVPDSPVGPNPTSRDTARYSFYNQLGLFTVPINTPANPLPSDSGLFKWDTVQPYAQAYANNKSYGSQIVRGFPIYFETEDVNTVWRNKLKGTVWANYQLIGSQWQATVTFPSHDTLIQVKTSAPAYLANSAIESFIPGNSSCIGCHSFAQTAVGTPADFSFLLGLAKKGQLNVAHVPQLRH